MSGDGEEWKDEDEAPRNPWGSLFFTVGAPETAEQKAERLAKEAQADLLGELLPPLRLAHRCVKCGHDQTKTRYCSGTASWCRDKCGKHEHMHRTCKRCKYEWYEKPLSGEDS